MATPTLVQTITHDRPGDRVGNCVAACVAAFFDVPLSEVPHFVELGICLTRDKDDKAAWWAMLLVQSVMEHRNPDMTPERYAAELDAWFTARRAERKPKRRRDPQTPHLHPESVPGCFRCDLREEESRG